ncbi:uncharacterized protein BXZ73DRAFT_55015 [Epithele typhae]|uniref:uncharacterized protein n=1 Tax=Epithele typhae TaxID=378194 RepID=UPI002008B1F6|nr:uncharacterized protein BXZ73DRAFT_55015 [Epithele typhae]KAH9914394.1 hypothetical protein BXZ73DRAFT_55015 [Epithele typhae]
MRAMTGDDMTRLPSLIGLLIRPIVLVGGVGHTYTARDEHGVLVGFLMFTLPGQRLLSTDEQRKMGMYSYVADLPKDAKDYFQKANIEDIPRVKDEIFGVKDSDRGMYWCNFAMVREVHQNKGLAARMFQMAFNEAATMNATVGLMTTNQMNVPVYESMGFALRGHETMQSPWTEYRIWCMSTEKRA